MIADQAQSVSASAFLPHLGAQTWKQRQVNTVHTVFANTALVQPRFTVTHMPNNCYVTAEELSAKEARVALKLLGPFMFFHI